MLQMIFTVVVLLLSCNYSNADEFNAIVSGSLGTASEGAKSHLLYGASLAINGQIYDKLEAEVRGGYANSKADYNMVVPYGTNVAVNGLKLNEDKFDYAALLAYPFSVGQATLKIQLGYRGILLNNSALDLHFGGPAIGAEGTLPLGKSSITAEIQATPIVIFSNKTKIAKVYSIDNSQTPTLAGDPQFLLNYGVTWWATEYSSMKIGIGYDGEMLSFQRKNRYANSLALRFKF